MNRTRHAPPQKEKMNWQPDQKHANKCEYWRHHQDGNEQAVVDIAGNDAENKIEWNHAECAYQYRRNQPHAILHCMPLLFTARLKPVTATGHLQSISSLSPNRQLTTMTGHCALALSSGSVSKCNGSSIRLLKLAMQLWESASLLAPQPTGEQKASDAAFCAPCASPSRSRHFAAVPPSA